MPNRPKININDFFDELAIRGIKHLYHSNSLETSISFLRSAALLSRGACATQSLPMSPQWSDPSDQKYNIWADVFLNLNDQHVTFKRPNKYGPILFELNSEKLRAHLLQSNSSVSITKIQPHDWNDINSDDEKWQKSFQDIFAYPKNTIYPKYLNGWPDIVISETGQYGLPIDICDKVIVDSHPSISNYYSQVEAIFQNCLTSHQISLTVEQRNCFVPNCKCKSSETNSISSLPDKYATLGWESKYGKIA